MILELRVKNSQASPENPGSCPSAFHLRFTALCRRTFGGRCGMFLTTTVASFVAQNLGTTRTDCVTKCYERTRKKVLFSTRRHVGRKRKGRLDLELFRQQKLARNLLSRYASQGAISPKPRSVQVAPNNPVYEALAAKLEPSRRSD
jgi:hypothetical protein